MFGRPESGADKGGDNAAAYASGDKFPKDRSMTLEKGPAGVAVAAAKLCSAGTSIATNKCGLWRWPASCNLSNVMVEGRVSMNVKVLPLGISITVGAAFTLFFEIPSPNLPKESNQTLPLDASSREPLTSGPPTDQNASAVSFNDDERQARTSSSPRHLPIEVWRAPDVYRFEEWFQEEPVDPAWAGQNENRLFDVLNASEVAYVDLVVECRTRICRVETAFNPKAGPQPPASMFFPFLEGHARLNGIQGRVDTERGLALYYIHSDGLAKVHSR